MDQKPNQQQPAPGAARPSGGVARATGVVALLTMLSRVFGLVRDIIVAVFFGAGFATDAFFVAFKIPNLLRRLVAEGSLAATFVPIFTEELHKSEEHGRRALGSVTTFTLILTTTLTALGVLFAPQITDLFAPGFAEQPGKRELAIDLLILMFPYVILVSLLALAGSALNALGHFAGPAAAPVLLNIALIIAALFFRDSFAEPITALGWGVLAGGVIAFVPQVILLRRRGFRMRLRSPFRDSAVNNLIRLMIPSVISASVYQIMVFINTLFASMLEEGSVSWLYYADRVFQFPLGVFSIALATAVLPAFSKLVAAGEKERLGSQLSFTLNWLSFICIPATCALWILAYPMVEAFYEHGVFSSSSTEQTARALRAYSVGLWSVSCHSVLVRAFLASKNTKTPAIISCFSILVNIFFAFTLMGPPAVEAKSAFAQGIAALQVEATLFDLGHVGLALAGSLASFASVGALTLFLPSLGITLNLQHISRSILKTVLASAVMSVALVGIMSLAWGALPTLFLGVPAGAVVYFLAAKLLGSPELTETVSVLRKLLRKTRD